MKKSKLLAYLISATLSFGAVHIAFAQDENPATPAAAPATEPAGAPEAAAEPAKPDAAAAEGENEKASEKPADGPDAKAIAEEPKKNAEEPKAADLPTDVGGLWGELLKAVTAGNWGLAVPLALLFLIGLAKFGREKFKLGFLAFLDKRWGKWGLLFVSSAAGMLATAQLAGAGISLRLIMQSLIFAFSTAGVYNFWQDVKKKE